MLFRPLPPHHAHRGHGCLPRRAAAARTLAVRTMPLHPVRRAKPPPGDCGQTGVANRRSHFASSVGYDRDRLLDRSSCRCYPRKYVLPVCVQYERARAWRAPHDRRHTYAMVCASSHRPVLQVILPTTPLASRLALAAWDIGTQLLVIDELVPLATLFLLACLPGQLFSLFFLILPNVKLFRCL